MKINRCYKIEKCVSKDPARSSLQNIYVSRRHAMATNGKTLALVPVCSEKNDIPGWLTPDALKHARRVSGKGLEEIHVSLDGEQVLPDGTTMMRPDGEEKPPRIFRILRQAHRDRAYKVGMNPSYLKDLADALGAEEVVMEFGNPDAAILVRPLRGEPGTVGLLMPVKINS